HFGSSGGCSFMPQFLCQDWWKRTQDLIPIVMHGLEPIFKPIRYLVGHVGFSLTACFWVCASFTFQDLQIWGAVGGDGLSFNRGKFLSPDFGFSGSVQYTTATPDEQGANYFQGCGSIEVSVCFMGDDGSPKHGFLGSEEDQPPEPGGKGW